MAVQLQQVTTGRAAERCCRAACEYGIDRVRHHLSRLLAYQRAGEQPGRLYSAPVLERFGSAPGDGETAALDVGRVVDQLRADGLPITAEAVALALCPWAVDAQAAHVRAAEGD